MKSYAIDTEMLASLLREAEEAHASYERSLGHADADWPAWYASYIIDELERQEHTPIGGG